MKIQSSPAFGAVLLNTLTAGEPSITVYTAQSLGGYKPYTVYIHSDGGNDLILADVDPEKFPKFKEAIDGIEKKTSPGNTGRTEIGKVLAAIRTALIEKKEVEGLTIAPPKTKCFGYHYRVLAHRIFMKKHAQFINLCNMDGNELTKISNFSRPISERSYEFYIPKK